MFQIREADWLRNCNPDSEEFRSLMLNGEDTGYDDPMHYYNIADMLGVPCMWKASGEHFCQMPKDLVFRHQEYPGTIVDRYWQSEKCHGPERPYMEEVERACDEYEADHPELQTAIEELCAPGSFFVHLRVGDMGVVSSDMLEDLSKSMLMYEDQEGNEIKNLYISTGVHANWANLPDQHRSLPWQPETEDGVFQCVADSLKIMAMMFPKAKLITGDVDPTFCLLRKAPALFGSRGTFSVILLLLNKNRTFSGRQVTHHINAAWQYNPHVLDGLKLTRWI